MYKLVAIDLDGTLLNSSGEISKKDKEAIRMAISKGIIVVLSSGRTRNAIENYAYELGANKYIISGNGASIYDVQNQNLMYNKYLNKEKVLKIIDICERNSAYYNVYEERRIITKSLNYNTLFYNSENFKKPYNKRTNIEIVDDIPKYIKRTAEKNFLKITVCDDDKAIFDGIIKKIKVIKNINILDISHMSRKTIFYGTEKKEIEYFYTEIMKESVNKWTAIEVLINKLGIKKEEVAAIGDNINDKEMLENAGLGIAMGNSMEYIKQAAKTVVADNNSNGIEEAINLIIST